MAQTLTKTVNQRADPNFRLDSLVARGVLVETGRAALGSYATGGISLTFAHIDPSKGWSIVQVPPQAGYTFSYDHVNEKLQAYVSAGSNAAQSELAAGTDLSGITALPYIAFGW